MQIQASDLVFQFTLHLYLTLTQMHCTVKWRCNLVNNWYMMELNRLCCQLCCDLISVHLSEAVNENLTFKLIKITFSQISQSSFNPVCICEQYLCYHCTWSNTGMGSSLLTYPGLLLQTPPLHVSCSTTVNHCCYQSTQCKSQHILKCA